LNEEKPAEDTDFGGVAAETPRVRAGVSFCLFIPIKKRNIFPKNTSY
jgi:hypothetical protein